MTSSGIGTRLYGRLSVTGWRARAALRGAVSAVDIAGAAVPAGYNGHSPTDAEILHLDRLAVLADRHAAESRT